MKLGTHTYIHAGGTQASDPHNRRCRANIKLGVHTRTYTHMRVHMLQICKTETLLRRDVTGYTRPFPHTHILSHGGTRDLNLHGKSVFIVG